MIKNLIKIVLITLQEPVFEITIFLYSIFNKIILELILDFNINSMISEQQKGTIINTLIKIDELNLPELLIDSKGLNPYTVEKFSAITKRVIVQLREELINGIGEYLPFQYNYQNEYSSGNLESDTNSLFTWIQNISNHSSAVIVLNRLVYYQIDNGFWDKSQRRIHNANDVKAKDIAEKVKTVEIITDKKIIEIQ